MFYCLMKFDSAAVNITVNTNSFMTLAAETQNNNTFIHDFY